MQNEVIFSLKGFHRKDEVAQGYVSYCPTVNVYSHGKSPDEAMDNLTKAVKLYLESCLKIETLDKIMRAAGFAPGELPAGTPLSAIEHEFVAVREKKFDTAFDMSIPFPLPGRSMPLAAVSHV
jgi:predicted RNase H-like HicB family nuclease